MPRVNRLRLAAFLMGALDPDEASDLLDRSKAKPRLAERLDRLAQDIVASERGACILVKTATFRLRLQPHRQPMTGAWASYEAELWTSEIGPPGDMMYLRLGCVTYQEHVASFSTLQPSDTWAEALTALGTDQQAQALIRAEFERTKPLRWRVADEQAPNQP